ncbi:MAG: type 1 glutamine amidotransferase [Verrucomicrobiales bacterium]|jgi:type 1 glutamine amidotransferase
MIRKFLSTALIALIGIGSLQAQDDKTQAWRKKAADRFKDNPTQEAKDKILGALPDSTPAKPLPARKILVFWRCEGFIHTSVPFANYAMAELGEKTGAFSVDLADEYTVFNSDNLAEYDAVLFNNTTNLDFPEESQKNALMKFVASGKGIVGIHAASDNFKKWPEAAAMIGGVFNGHPWGGGGNWAFEVNDTKSPITAAFNGQGFWHTDEIYWYKPESFQGDEKLRVLVSLDMSKSKNIQVLLKSKDPKSEAEAKSVKVAVSWIREFNGGRVFYSNIGHRDDTFWNPAILKHYLAGIQYALGDLEADATPTADAGDLRSAAAPNEEG